MFKKVGVFIVLKFRTCEYKSVGLWLMIKGSSVGIIRFRNCWRTCSVAVPSVFSSIFPDRFPWRTLAVVQILHYIHVERFLFKSVKWLVDWDCLQNFFLYVWTRLPYATNTKLDKFICSKRVLKTYIRVQFAVSTKLTNCENCFTHSRGTHGCSFQLRVSEDT